MFWKFLWIRSCAYRSLACKSCKQLGIALCFRILTGDKTITLCLLVVYVWLYFILFYYFFVLLSRQNVLCNIMISPEMIISFCVPFSPNVASLWLLFISIESTWCGIMLICSLSDFGEIGRRLRFQDTSYPKSKVHTGKKHKSLRFYFPYKKKRKKKHL